MRIRRPGDLYAALAALRLAARLGRLVAALRSTRLRRLLRRSCAPALAFALAVAPLAAQVPGEEQQVSALGELGVRPSVAMDDQGAFVVTWEDTSELVMIRRYGADGAALGPPEPVSESITVGGDRPDIAADDEGAFVVAWEGYGPDEFSGNIYVQRYDAEGQRLEPTLDASGATDSRERSPSVAMNAEGEFVVAWDVEPFSTSTSGTIEFRRFAGDGSARDSDGRFVTSGFVNSPSIALDDDGDFVLVWERDGDIYGTRYSSATDQLDPLRDGGRLNDQTSSFQGRPSVAIDADGSFVVAWSDQVLDDVVAQRFTPDGELDGAQLIVSDRFPDGASLFSGSNAPQAAYLTTGPVVAWAYQGDTESDDDNALVFRRFGATDPIDATEQEVAELFASGGRFADIAGSPVGSFVVVWQAEVDTCNDGCFDPAVFARLYTPRNSYSVSTNTAGTNEGSGALVSFRVTRGSAVGESRVGYTLGGSATLGDDYTIERAPPDVITTTGTISFATGISERQIELALINDTRGEPTKSIVLTLRGLFPGDRLVFPVAIVTLGDDDLSEVRITQTGGSTVVTQGGPADTLAVALRTVPTHRVTVTLSPTDRRLNLGMGYGAPLQLVFQPDESAKTAQQVRVFTSGLEEGAALAANAGISLGASSADPAYDRGTRFTVDGRDLGTIPVDLIVPPGENPNPKLPSLFLPLIQR